MNNRFFRKYSLLLHVLIWMVVLFIPYIVSSRENNYAIGFVPGLFFTIAGIIHLLLFYSNAYLLIPKLLNRRLWWLYVIGSIFLLIASVQVKYIIARQWFPQIPDHPNALKFMIVPSIVIFIISMIYRFVLDKNRAEKKQQEIQEKQLESELKFLRSQINPHFLFNVLINLVSLARKRSADLEPALLQLSDLMRYMIYDAPSRKISLTRELEYLNTFIQLQLLRFGADVQIEMKTEIPPDQQQLTIEPMLLIPFVENAFKHGTNQTQPAWISVAISVMDGWLSFHIRNNFVEAPPVVKQEEVGIGLENVRSRLDLLYQRRYSLKMDDANGIFDVHLKINLI